MSKGTICGPCPNSHFGDALEKPLQKGFKASYSHMTLFHQHHFAGIAVASSGETVEVKTAGKRISFVVTSVENYTIAP